MRRLSISMLSNITEGKHSSTKKDFKRFVSIAYGSGVEIKTQVEIEKILPKTKNINYSKIDVLFLEVTKMLAKVTNSLKI